MSKLIDQLEEQRISSAYKFLQGRGIKSKLNLTISELSRLVFDLQDKQRLLSIQARLSETLNELKQLNELNRQLIEQALSYIDFSVETMSYYEEFETTYHRPDEKNSTIRSGLFDTRA